MVRTALLFASLAAVATPAAADGFDGQAFLDARAGFAEGYAFAIMEEQTSVAQNGSEYYPYQFRYQKCFGSGFTSTNLYEAVRRHIEAHPASLLQPALLAVAATMAEICPPPPQ